MKRVIYTSLLSIFICSSLFAQVWEQNFNNGIPSTFRAINNDGLPAHQSAISYDGIAWKAFNQYIQNNSRYDPPGQADDWIITDEIILPQQSGTNKLMFSWEATCTLWSEQSSYEIWISTTGNTLDDFLNTGVLLSTVVDENAGGFTKRSTDISAYVGQGVWIAIRDVSFDKRILTVDNFLIEEYVAHDLQLTDLSFFSFYENDTQVSVRGSILNFGHEQVNSITINYSLNGVVETRTLSSFSIDQFSSNNFTHPIDFTGSDEVMLIEVWISEVNGSPNTNLDSLERNVIFYDSNLSTDRDGLVETFTSSTCGPCKAANEHLIELLNDLGDDAPMSIKHQQNFPGTGDPYATLETIERRNHYDVSGIPRSVINGRLYNSSTSLVEAEDLVNANMQAGLVSMDGSYVLHPDNHSVSMEVSIEPVINMIPNTRLFFAIVERETVNNVKTNGEFFFDNVVKKLIPDENGYDISNLVSGQELVVAMDYTFPGDYRLPENGAAANRIDLASEHSVEDFEELYVIAWVDHKYDTWVLGATELLSVSNTGNLSSTTEVKILSTENGFSLDSELGVFQELVIMDASGKLIKKQTFRANEFVSTENWISGIYVINLLGKKERKTLKHFVK